MQILKWLRLHVTYWYCRLKYPILYNIHNWKCLVHEWLPKHLPVLITNFFFLCSRQIRLKNIWYHVCFDKQTVYLVMMMMMVMMMMIQVVFQHVMWKLHMMQLLKYAENKSYDDAIMSHLFSAISLYICSFLDVAIWNFSIIVFVCSCSAKFFHL